MQISRKFQMVRRTFQMFSIPLLLFVTSPNYAIAYGGHGYGHHGYGHHGYGVQYSHHGHIGTAGYVFLGILGVAVLSQILDHENDKGRRYHKTSSYNQPPTQPRRVSVHSKSKPVYIYSEKEGWDKLANGNTDYALDIFAIQSQQNLNSGIPKIGFAIAVATNGETDRATRAMRRAIRVDAAALDKININNLQATLEMLSKNYKVSLSNNMNNIDHAFMIATFAYLKHDYATASEIILENDQSQSANNLRELIVLKQG